MFSLLLALSVITHPDLTLLTNPDLTISDHPKFGKVVSVNGQVQYTEADEALRHEMLAHVALCAHKAPMCVLLVGGANGGVLREVLKHTVVQRVVVVVPEKILLNAFQTHLPSLANGAFDDPRVQLVFATPEEFLKQTSETFDVIFSDVHVPAADVKAHLQKAGIFVHQSGYPLFEKNVLAQTLEEQKSHFKQVSFYLIPIPGVDGPMAVGFASNKKYRPSEKALRARIAGLGTLRYYNPAVHRAAFALPTFMTTGISTTK